MNANSIAERFARDTAKHELTILHDDGLYRHLRFRSPKSSEYWFDLVTWPGTLAIRGDMDSFMFAREVDMFDFMRREQPNPQYWAKKEQTGAPTKQFSEELFRQAVWTYVREGGQEYPGLAKAVQAEIFDSGYCGDEGTARQALEDFEYFTPTPGPGPVLPFTFDDVWEMSFGDWTAQYLWCCQAIVWGIAQYDAERQAELKLCACWIDAHGDPSDPARWPASTRLGYADLIADLRVGASR